MYVLAPSLLGADFTMLRQQILAVEEAGAGYLHLDVMDGRFVPNISFGMPVIASHLPGIGTYIVSHCEDPCTESSCGRMFYLYPEKDLRAYPGTLRGIQEWDATCKIRVNVEKSINHFKDSFCVAGRKTQNEKTIHALKPLFPFSFPPALENERILTKIKEKRLKLSHCAESRP